MSLRSYHNIPCAKAYGVSEEQGRGAIRFSLGRCTTKEDIDFTLERLVKIIK